MSRTLRRAPVANQAHPVRWGDDEHMIAKVRNQCPTCQKAHARWGYVRDGLQFGRRRGHRKHWHAERKAHRVGQRIQLRKTGDYMAFKPREATN